MLVAVEDAVERRLEETKDASEGPLEELGRVRKEEPREPQDHAPRELQHVETKVLTKSETEMQFFDCVQLVKLDVLNVKIEHISVLDLDWNADQLNWRVEVELLPAWWNFPSQELVVVSSGVEARVRHLRQVVLILILLDEHPEH